EMAFQGIEESYCRCIDKLKAGNSLNSNEVGIILLMMIDLHLRNAAHKNATGQEGIKAYERRNQIFFNELLLCRKDGSATQTEVQECFSRYWNFTIFTSPPKQNFITSDNPSVWLTLKKNNPSLDVVIM